MPKTIPQVISSTDMFGSEIELSQRLIKNNEKAPTNRDGIQKNLNSYFVDRYPPKIALGTIAIVRRVSISPPFSESPESTVLAMRGIVTITIISEVPYRKWIRLAATNARFLNISKGIIECLIFYF